MKEIIKKQIQKDEKRINEEKEKKKKNYFYSCTYYHLATLHLYLLAKQKNTFGQLKPLVNTQKQ